MKEILKSLAEGEISIEECETLLKAESIRELDEVAQIDTSRKDRTGFPEAILADSKDYDDLLTIIKRFFEKQESEDNSIELKIILSLQDYLRKGMNHWKRIWLIFLKRESSLITIRELKF